MKKLLIIALLFCSFAASAQLTLSEKSTLASTESFRSRVYQGLFSKATYWITVGTPTNLKEQKQITYAKNFVKGGGGGIDMNVMVRFWLANFNTAPQLDSNSQPIDNNILNTAALDTVFDTLAGVLPGDQSLPIQ